MDYSDILKRAWRVAWRYKILWLFGFFAGAGAGVGGGGGSGSGYRTSSTSQQPFTQANWDQVMAFLQRYMVVLVVAGLMLLLFWLIMLIISVAARGGLIHLVNEAEDGRPVQARDGWRVGFAKWWRVFGVGFLAAIPTLLLGLAILAIVGAGVVMAIRTGSFATLGSRLVGTLVGGGCLVLIFVLVAVFLSIVLSIAAELGMRYVVLQDHGAIAGLKEGWHDLWSRRGAFLMYLIQVGLGLAYGIVVAIVAGILIIPGIIAGLAGAWALTGVMVGVAILVLIVPSAAYAAFYHAVWTIFFRKMTGLEPQPAALAGVPSGSYPMMPPPPYPPAPPAPPTMPAPMAPPMAPEAMPMTLEMPEAMPPAPAMPAPEMPAPEAMPPAMPEAMPMPEQWPPASEPPAEGPPPAPTDA